MVSNQSDSSFRLSSESSDEESSFEPGNPECQILFNREHEGIEADYDSDTDSEKSLEYLYDQLSLPLTPTARLLVKTTAIEMRRVIAPQVKLLQEKARQYDLLKAAYELPTFEDDSLGVDDLRPPLEFNSEALLSEIETTKRIREAENALKKTLKPKNKSTPNTPVSTKSGTKRKAPADSEYESFPILSADDTFNLADTQAEAATPNNTREEADVSQSVLLEGDEIDLLDGLYLGRDPHEHTSRSLEARLELIAEEGETTEISSESAFSSRNATESSEISTGSSTGNSMKRILTVLKGLHRRRGS
ncbi:unnamed protein product [Kuraishia capsulata CBS 1993]|uniref:Uncharacterized protein n=1 Tax=Kuraishia capsulata CBS 1993 TaxID=1382522 RepID=W6MQH1_9ASCO|nr:uncharacterized protein KUCA_T00000100001 [Kuraishia capsulata CBS 1993]CDK24140.1 unnamed protein product [Kuraishia capsulata CBS 1993]